MAYRNNVFEIPDLMDFAKAASLVASENGMAAFVFHPMTRGEWLAGGTILIGWPNQRGLGGQMPVEWVAEWRGIRRYPPSPLWALCDLLHDTARGSQD